MNTPSPTVWVAEPVEIERPLGESVRNGLKCRCPACGTGKLYRSYLKTVENCASCGLYIGGHQADDAPPYFTITIVGHIIVSLMLWVELAYEPPMWLHMTLWPILTVVMALAMLPPIKGAIIAWQYAHRMHGFAPGHDDTPV